jgi:hypothetical protein
VCYLLVDAIILSQQNTQWILLAQGSIEHQVMFRRLG